MPATKTSPVAQTVCCIFLCEGDRGIQGWTVTEVSQGAALALLLLSCGEFAAN